MNQVPPISAFDLQVDNNKDAFAVKAYRASDERYPSTLAAGYLRYEALRKLKPLQFEELHRRNLAGENFDDMVTELVVVGEAEFFSKEKTK